MGGLYEPCQRGNRAPCDQDAGDPHTRADPMKDQVAGNFKQEVAPKENPGGEPELLAGDCQLPIHCQRREPQVDPVDEREHKKHKQERKQPDPDFADRRLLGCACERTCATHHGFLAPAAFKNGRAKYWMQRLVFTCSTFTLGLAGTARQTEGGAPVANAKPSSRKLQRMLTTVLTSKEKQRFQCR